MKEFRVRSGPSTSSLSVLLVRLPLALLLLAALVLVGLPTAAVILQLLDSARELPDSLGLRPPGIGVAFSTLGYVVTIAGLATALALPAGWWLGRGRPSTFFTALIALPVLLPGYLITAGWGFLRGPGTWFGDRLALQTPEIIVAANRMTAVIGLALWAWPIAALLIAARARRIPAGVLDSLTMDPVGPLGRVWLILRLLRPALVGSFMVIGLLMLGSAIPLHVARARTWAIEVWAMLNLTTSTAEIWSAAWPLLLIALVASWVVWRRVSLPSDEFDADPAVHRSKVGQVGAGVRTTSCLIWGASVIAPFVIFLWMLREPSSLLRWWGDGSFGLTDSLARGVLVGLALCGVLAAAWCAAALARGVRTRSVLATTAVLFGGVGLMPGVLIGVAWNSLTSSTSIGEFGRQLAESEALPILVHLTRFSFVAVLVGVAMAAGEPREQRWNRAIDGAETISGWARVELAEGGKWLLVGVAVLGMMLSVQEIEATVIVQPPGMVSFAQQLLDGLHFSRDEQMAAAGANLLVVGTACALVGGWLVMRGTREHRGRGSPC